MSESSPFPSHRDEGLYPCFYNDAKFRQSIAMRNFAINGLINKCQESLDYLGLKLLDFTTVANKEPSARMSSALAINSHLEDVRSDVPTNYGEWNAAMVTIRGVNVDSEIWDFARCFQWMGRVKPWEPRTKPKRAVPIQPLPEGFVPGIAPRNVEFGVNDGFLNGKLAMRSYLGQVYSAGLTGFSQLETKDEWQEWWEVDVEHHSSVSLGAMQSLSEVQLIAQGVEWSPLGDPPDPVTPWNDFLVLCPWKPDEAILSMSHRRDTDRSKFIYRPDLIGFPWPPT